MLQRYATILRRALEKEPLTLQKAGMKMRAQAGFSEAMGDAMITGVGAFKRFLDLFPEFAVEGRAPKAVVRLVEGPPPAPAGPLSAIVEGAAGPPTRIRVARIGPSRLAPASSSSAAPAAPRLAPASVAPGLAPASAAPARSVALSAIVGGQGGPPVRIRIARLPPARR